jgi:hypothetical protein
MLAPASKNYLLIMAGYELFVFIGLESFFAVKSLIFSTF